MEQTVIAQSAIPCPSCQEVLPLTDKAAYCSRCEIQLVVLPTRGNKLLAYALSLPERLSRIFVGSAAGMVKGVSDFLLPAAVRQTKLYQVLLKKNLRYLIKEVGAVPDVFPKEPSQPARYLARKFVGNFVELAGILSMRASPVWILALVSDISGGTKVFLKELADELRREGLLGSEAQVETVDQLLDGLQSFAGEVADRIDTPPLSVEELRETLEYLRQDAQRLKLKNPVKPEDISAMLQQMKEIARRENRSLFEISTAMAINAMNHLERSGRTAVTGLRVGKALLDRTIFQYYSSALRDLTKWGYYRYLGRASKPYLKAIVRNLSWNNVTWTERYFLSRAAKRIVQIPVSPQKVGSRR